MEKITPLEILQTIKAEYTNNPISPPESIEQYASMIEHNGHRNTFIFTQDDNPNEYKIVNSQKVSASLNDYPIYRIYRYLKDFNLLKYDDGEDEPEELYIDPFKLESKIRDLKSLKQDAKAKRSKIKLEIISIIIAIIGLIHSCFKD